MCFVVLVTSSCGNVGSEIDFSCVAFPFKTPTLDVFSVFGLFLNSPLYHAAVKYPIQFIDKINYLVKLHMMC